MNILIQHIKSARKIIEQTLHNSYRSCRNADQAGFDVSYATDAFVPVIE
jgi:hypothetical protein